MTFQLACISPERREHEGNVSLKGREVVDGRSTIAMPVERYRIKIPIVGVLSDKQGGGELLTVPEGSFVEISKVLSDETPALTELLWESKRVRVFTVDFQERAELVKVERK
jgi:hypothetical protein